MESTAIIKRVAEAKVKAQEKAKGKPPPAKRKDPADKYTEPRWLWVPVMK